MKANEAQEKIWLGKYTQNLMLSDPNSNTYVEYVRKDTFIEKAVKWLKENNKEYILVDIDDKYVGVDGLFFKDFKNAMKL